MRGFDGYNASWTNGIKMCQINDDQYKWTSFGVNLPRNKQEFVYLLTNDERYIIAACDTDIYYLEIGGNKWEKVDITFRSNNNRWSKSRIHCLAMTGHKRSVEMIVYGLARDLNSNNGFLPSDVAQMKREDIHW